MDRFYLVWNPKTGYTMFKHYSLDTAKQEAERLSRLHPNDEFHILTSLGKCKVADVIWDKTPSMGNIEIDELPF